MTDRKKYLDLKVFNALAGSSACSTRIINGIAYSCGRVIQRKNRDKKIDITPQSVTNQEALDFYKRYYLAGKFNKNNLPKNFSKYSFMILELYLMRTGLVGDQNLPAQTTSEANSKRNLDDYIDLPLLNSLAVTSNSASMLIRGLLGYLIIKEKNKEQYIPYPKNKDALEVYSRYSFRGKFRASNLPRGIGRTAFGLLEKYLDACRLIV